MNLEKLHRRLIDAARREAGRTGVPQAFEERVMARLRARSPVDPLAAWASGMWRAAISAVAVCALVVSLQLVFAGPAGFNESDGIGELPDLEAVLFAPLETATD